MDALYPPTNLVLPRVDGEEEGLQNISGGGFPYPLTLPAGEGGVFATR